MSLPNEMIDEISDRERRDRLGEYLRGCQAQLVQHYANASQKAGTWQTAFRAVAAFVAGLGFLGLLSSIGLLTLAAMRAPEPGALHRIELVCVFIATAFVLVGLVLSYLKIWLVWRTRAEAYRQLKFRLLVRPALWTSGQPAADGWDAWLRQGVDAAQALDRHRLEPLARDEPLGELAALPGAFDVTREDLRTLVDYYLRRRLAAQIGYFEMRSSRRSRWDNPRLLPLFFFGGVACAAAHVIDPEGEHGAVFLGLSLLAPVAWAAIRTWRSANEFSRNAARAQAKRAALQKIHDALEAVPTEPEPDAPRAFRLLALSEALLASEQREWLRLMLDAEWYG
jgi:hypothetical protein